MTDDALSLLTYVTHAQKVARTTCRSYGCKTDAMLTQWGFQF